jgi:trehalose/maltose hydrolase-like predicted phosphorylase
LFRSTEGFGYKELTPINQTAHNGTQGAIFPSFVGFLLIESLLIPVLSTGWPLFTPRAASAMVAGFYDQQPETEGTNFEQTNGEQPISLLPTWSSLYLTINNETYSTSTPTSQISNWTQSLSIQDGIVSTSLNFSPAGENSTVAVTYTIFTHRTEPNLGGVRLQVSGLSPADSVSVADVLDVRPFFPPPFLPC